MSKDFIIESGLDGHTNDRLIQLFNDLKDLGFETKQNYHVFCFEVYFLGCENKNIMVDIFLKTDCHRECGFAIKQVGFGPLNFDTAQNLLPEKVKNIICFYIDLLIY